jgi:hypothetical protein
LYTQHEEIQENQFSCTQRDHEKYFDITYVTNKEMPISDNNAVVTLSTNKEQNWCGWIKNEQRPRANPAATKFWAGMSITSI